MGLNVERELSLKNQFLPPIVQDSGEPLLILRIVESSGNVRMERQTDMNVLQDWLMIRSNTVACGLVRFLNVAFRLFPLMRLRSLLVLPIHLLVLSLSIPTLLIADNFSFVLEEFQESKDVHWVKFLMQKLFLNVQITMLTILMLLRVLPLEDQPSQKEIEIITNKSLFNYCLQLIYVHFYHYLIINHDNHNNQIITSISFPLLGHLLQLIQMCEAVIASVFLNIKYIELKSL